MTPTGGIFLFGMLDMAAALAATVLLQTSVLCIAGILVIAWLRTYGPLAQSFAARTVLVLLLLTPLTALVTVHYRTISVTIPALSPAQPFVLRHVPASSGPVTEHEDIPLKERDVVSVPVSTSIPQQAQTYDVQSNSEIIGSPQAEPVILPESVVSTLHNRVVEQPRSDRAGISAFLAFPALRLVLYTGGLLIWFCVSMVVLFRSVRAYLLLRRLRTYMLPVSAEVSAQCNQLAVQLGITPPRIRRIPDLVSPLVTGIRHPLLLLPVDSAASGKKLEQVMVHELTHIKRRDQLWNLLRQMMLIMIPVQPLAWSLARHLDETSDYVCDQVVTSATGDRRTYAETLLEIACRYPGNMPIPGLGAGLFSVASPLRRRISRIMSAVSGVAPHLSARAASMVIVVCVSFALTSGLIGVELKPLEPVRRILSYQAFSALWGLAGSPSTALRSILFSEHVDAEQATHETEKAPVVMETNRVVQDIAKTPDFPVSQRFEMGATEHDGIPERMVSAAQPAKVAESNAEAPAMVIQNALSTNRTRATHDSDIWSYELTTQPAGGTGAYIADARDGMAPSSFLAQHRGSPMPALSGQRIVMPVAKAVNVNVPEYQSGMFDLTDETQKAQYNLYASLDKNKNEPAWSPDGKHIAFTDQNRIWIVPVSGGEPHMVFENFYYHGDHQFPIGGIESIVFTPDGQSLVFKLDTYDTERGSSVTIKDYVKGQSSAYFEKPIPCIVQFNLETEKLTLLADGGYNCTVSPDGNSIVYITADMPLGNDDETMLYHPVLMNLEANETRYLNTDPSLVFGRPAFDADGMHIVIPCREDQSVVTLCRISLLDDSIVCIADDEKEQNNNQYIGFPAVSPDGEWILYTDFSLVANRPNKRLMLYSTLSGQQFEMFPEAEDRRSYGVWSPDGTQICYLATEPGGNVLYICRFEPRLFKVTIPAHVDEMEEPLAFSLDDPYPNPFNNAVSIQYVLPEPAHVTLVIYNVMGQRVRELIHEHQTTGQHTVQWDGRDEHGNNLSSGIYITRIITAVNEATKKMTLVK